MSFWSRAGKFISKSLTGITFVTVLLMMFVVVANITGRRLFNTPIWGAVEGVGLMGIILISFALSFTERDRGHIKVGVLTDKFKGKTRLILDISSYSLGIIVVLLLVLGGILELWQAITTPGSYTVDLGINYTPFKAIWVLGCTTLAGFLLYHLIKELKNK